MTKKKQDHRDMDLIFDRWPLGINEEMDRHAEKNELGHWSCVSPLSNEWWVRKDGKKYIAKFHQDRGYISELQMVDDGQMNQCSKCGSTT